VAAPEVVVFDVDGVLVEVTESYREAIRAAVRHFTGQDVSPELIQEFKNQGGWNNDWDLTHRFIRDFGRDVPYDAVVDKFNEIFFGKDGDGLILREQWIPHDGFFSELQNHSKLAIFTGRVRYELEPTIRRFAAGINFDPVVTADDVENPKPAPDGLRLIQARHPESAIWYIGDTVDDARSAKLAGTPFIGIAAPSSPRYAELANTLKQNGAFAVLNDVNELPGLIKP
jgi:HAD superfamily hydrolase (TIGR01548 family)